jgi:hypothetical protein
MGTYRPPLIGRWFFVVGFGILGVASVFLVPSVIADPDADAGSAASYLAFWFVALAWNGYWWLFRIAFSLTLGDGVLAWEAPLRRGHVALPDLVAFRPMRFVPNVVVIEPRTGRKVLVLPGKGLARFAAALAAASPTSDVRVGPWTSTLDRFPGPSGWRPAP